MPLFDVRAAERGRFGWFAGLAALLAFAQMLGQAGTEAIFLARLGAAQLPLAFVLASVATVAASLASVSASSPASATQPRRSK